MALHLPFYCLLLRLDNARVVGNSEKTINLGKTQSSRIHDVSGLCAARRHKKIGDSDKTTANLDKNTANSQIK